MAQTLPAKRFRPSSQLSTEAIIVCFHGHLWSHHCVLASQLWRWVSWWNCRGKTCSNRQYVVCLMSHWVTYWYEVAIINVFFLLLFSHRTHVLHDLISTYTHVIPQYSTCLCLFLIYVQYHLFIYMFTDRLWATHVYFIYICFDRYLYLYIYIHCIIHVLCTYLFSVYRWIIFVVQPCVFLSLSVLLFFYWWIIKFIFYLNTIGTPIAGPFQLNKSWGICPEFTQWLLGAELKPLGLQEPSVGCWYWLLYHCLLTASKPWIWKGCMSLTSGSYITLFCG